MAVYHHGVEVHETTDLSTLIRDIDTSVIGIVCTAEDADPEAFPLDTPALVTRIKTVLSKAGKTGTLYTTLKAIDDQCSPKVVVVRVAIDKTLTPSLVKDIVDGINRKGAQLVTQGRLLGFQCWYDPSDNPKENLRDGKAHIRYKYTPVPPLENLSLTQEFTDEYFTVFDQLG